MYEIVKPLVAEVIVCNPRRNKLLAVGNKADRVDAQKLAELLRCGQLKPVYHGTPGVRVLKELVHSYDAGERYDAGDESGEGDLSGTSDRLRGAGCVLPAEPGAMVGEVDRAGSAAAGRVSLPATGHVRRLRREAKKAMLKESGRHPAYAIETDSGAGALDAQILAKVASRTV